MSVPWVFRLADRGQGRLVELDLRFIGVIAKVGVRRNLLSALVFTKTDLSLMEYGARAKHRDFSRRLSTARFAAYWQEQPDFSGNS